MASPEGGQVDVPQLLADRELLEQRVATLTAEVRAATDEMAEAKALGLGIHHHQQSQQQLSQPPHQRQHVQQALSPPRYGTPHHTPQHPATPQTDHHQHQHHHHHHHHQATELYPAPPTEAPTQYRKPAVVSKTPADPQSNTLPRPALESFYRNHPEYKPNGPARTYFSVNPVDGLLTLCAKYGCDFRDFDFDTDAVDPVLAQSLGRSGDVVFRRLVDVGQTAELFGASTEAPSFDDIDWGPTDLGHWVISCLAIVIQEFSAQGRDAQRDPTSARHMGGARFMLHPDKENRHGVYVVRFFIDAAWRYVVVDDLVPCNSAGRPLLPTARLATGGMFLTLVVKALAKLCGGYGALTATHPLSKKVSAGLRHPYGHVAEALCDMSGGVALAPSLPHPRSERFVAPWAPDASTDARAAALETFCDVMWDHLDELLMDLGAEVVTVASETSAGLRRGAVYRVLETATAELPSEGRKPLRLLRLHAPYGDIAWAGPWAPDSREWQDAPRLAKALCPRTEMDGSFWMEFVDLLNHFEYTAAVKAFTGWNELSLSGELVYNPRRPQCPVYKMQVTQACKVFISIHERDPRACAAPQDQSYEMGFKLVPEGNATAVVLKPAQRHPKLAHHLQQGPLSQYGTGTVQAGTYLLVPTCEPRHLNPRVLDSLRQQRAELKFTLRVFARSAFVLVERQGSDAL